MILTLKILGPRDYGSLYIFNSHGFISLIVFILATVKCLSVAMYNYNVVGDENYGRVLSIKVCYSLMAEGVLR